MFLCRRRVSVEGMQASDHRDWPSASQVNRSRVCVFECMCHGETCPTWTWAGGAFEEEINKRRDRRPWHAAQLPLKYANCPFKLWCQCEITTLAEYLWRNSHLINVGWNINEVIITIKKLIVPRIQGGKQIHQGNNYSICQNDQNKKGSNHS